MPNADRDTREFKGDRLDPMAFGAKGNFRQTFDGQIATGHDILTCPSGPFRADLQVGGNLFSEVGKLIWIQPQARTRLLLIHP